MIAWCPPFLALIYKSKNFEACHTTLLRLLSLLIKV
jgi:hypothetical protein